MTGTGYAVIALPILTLVYVIAYNHGRSEVATPAQNALIIEYFAAMVNETDEDYELAEEHDARSAHQNRSEMVLSEWLVTIDAPEPARKAAFALLRWKS